MIVACRFLVFIVVLVIILSFFFLNIYTFVFVFSTYRTFTDFVSLSLTSGISCT